MTEQRSGQHAPEQKLSPKDPSLCVPRPVGRRLRKGPVAVTLLGLVALAALLVGLATSVHGNADVRREAGERERDDEFAKPTIPESVRNAAVVIEHEPPVVPVVPVNSASVLPSVPDKPTKADNGPYSPSALRQKRLAEYWKARGSSILVQSGTDPGVDDELEESTHDGSIETGRNPVPRRSAARSTDSATAEDPNLQLRKNEFMAEDGYGAGNVPSVVRRSRSPFELKPGTIVPAVLETAINSDLPGPVIARVTQNICDTARGDWLLIPQGSTLIAYYDSMVAWGQERVLVCWKQLELADGGSLDLGCMPAADAAGQAGFHDQVDEHWWRIITGAAVASLLSAATTAAAGSTAGYNPTVPQSLARGAASEIASVGEEITRRNIHIQPTLTIRQGMPVNVIITKAIDFRPDGPGTPCRPDGL